jgi:alpha-L-fucosidase 2
MKKTLFKPMLVALVMLFVASVASVNAQDYASKMKLWYNSASGVTEKDVKGEYTSWFTTKKDGATKWMEYALPIGNGQLGATFIGNVDTEYLQFNEKTLWTGDKDDFSYGAGSSYDYGAYQNFGYLKITTGHSSSSNYNRELDLSTATGKVSYTSSSVNYTREYIASYPHNVVVARFSANKTGKQNLTISLTKGQGLSNGSVSYSNGVISLSGKLTTVSYGARIKVINIGGTITTSSSNIKVSNADEVYIVLAAGTNFDASQASYVSGDVNSVLSLAASRIDAAVAQGWDAVYAAHVADHQSYFNRVSLELDGVENNVPTNQLITDYNAATGARNHMLEQLYYQYGRYLAIAASRGADSPANLQGIWNNTCTPPWHSDIHANINVQMNYWPVEAGNLSEMHEPFVNYIINEAA